MIEQQRLIKEIEVELDQIFTLHFPKQAHDNLARLLRDPSTSLFLDRLAQDKTDEFTELEINEKLNSLYQANKILKFHIKKATDFTANTIVPKIETLQDDPASKEESINKQILAIMDRIQMAYKLISLSTQMTTKLDNILNDY